MRAGYESFLTLPTLLALEFPGRLISVFRIHPAESFVVHLSGVNWALLASECCRSCGCKRRDLVVDIGFECALDLEMCNSFRCGGI